MKRRVLLQQPGTRCRQSHQEHRQISRSSEAGNQRSSENQRKRSERRQVRTVDKINETGQPEVKCELDGCIVWNAHKTVLGEEALLIHIVPVGYAT